MPSRQNTFHRQNTSEIIFMDIYLNEFSFEQNTFIMLSMDSQTSSSPANTTHRRPLSSLFMGYIAAHFPITQDTFRSSFFWQETLNNTSMGRIPSRFLWTGLPKTEHLRFFLGERSLINFVYKEDFQQARGKGGHPSPSSKKLKKNLEVFFRL